MEELNIIRECCQALDNKKAQDIRLLDMGGKSSVTDFFVIATATSEPHLRALRKAVQAVLDDHKTDLYGSDYSEQSGWMCLDAVNFMVHLFTPQQRENYKLESLWKDAEIVPFEELATA